MCFMENWLRFVLLFYRFLYIEVEVFSGWVIIILRLDCKMSIKNYFRFNGCDK